MVKVLVTGGTGFIGRKLVEELVKQRYNVRCLVRNIKKAEIFNHLNVELIQGDMEDYGVFDKATKDIKIIFHLAGISRQKNFSKNEYYKINVEGTRKLIESAIRNKVSKFVYCSSISVIGWDGEFPKDETSECNPNGTYGWSKLLAEKEVLKLKNKIHCCIIRPSITYGQDDFDGMVFKLSRMIYHNRFLRVGNVENYVHLVDRSKLVESFILAAKHGKNGKVYIIADENPIKFKKLVDIVCETLGRKQYKFYVPLFIAKLIAAIFEKISNSEDPFLTRHKIDIIVKNRHYNIEKAKNEIGYLSNKDTEGTIKKTIGKYLEEGVLR